MYLRKNRVRCGDKKRTYLSVAHNVWWPRKDGKGQSRPVVILNLGEQSGVDVELAQDLVRALERNLPTLRVENRDEIRRITNEFSRRARTIEKRVKLLVSHKVGAGEMIPAGDLRDAMLDALLSDWLTDPQPREAHMVREQIRSILGARAA
jgi:hypothetical protein